MYRHTFFETLIFYEKISREPVTLEHKLQTQASSHTLQATGLKLCSHVVCDIRLVTCSL
jgi:hypothetical protein